MEMVVSIVSSVLSIIASVVAICEAKKAKTARDEVARIKETLVIKKDFSNNAIEVTNSAENNGTIAGIIGGGK